jgi:hypothetical protein
LTATRLSVDGRSHNYKAFPVAQSTQEVKLAGMRVPGLRDLQSAKHLQNTSQLPVKPVLLSKIFVRLVKGYLKHTNYSLSIINSIFVKFTKLAKNTKNTSH